MDRDNKISERVDFVPDREELLLGDLLKLMENQAALYGDLSQALSDEKSMVVSLDLKGLAETGWLKGILVAKIQGLEKDRVKLMNDLAEMFSVNPKELTVSKLIDRTRGYHNKRMIGLRGTLLKLVEQIRQMNRLNKMLVRHTLELIRGSYSFLSQLAAPDSVYQSSGGLRLRHQSGKFISNTI